MVDQLGSVPICFLYLEVFAIIDDEEELVTVTSQPAAASMSVILDPQKALCRGRHSLSQ